MIVIDNNPVEVSREVVDAMPAVAPTRTWNPTSHRIVLEAVEERLDASGIIISQSKYVVSHGGHRLFATMQLQNAEAPDGIVPTAAVRNSTDQKYACGIAAGMLVICCSNGSLASDFLQISRKHTSGIGNDLPILTARAVDALHALWARQKLQVEGYRTTRLSELRARSLIVDALDAGVVAASAIPHVLREWRTPSYPAFKERTVYSLFNAFTEVAKKDNVFSLPARTQALHRLCDQFVGIN